MFHIVVSDHKNTQGQMRFGYEPFIDKFVFVF